MCASRPRKCTNRVFRLRLGVSPASFTESSRLHNRIVIAPRSAGFAEFCYHIMEPLRHYLYGPFISRVIGRRIVQLHYLPLAQVGDYCGPGRLSGVSAGQQRHTTETNYAAVLRDEIYKLRFIRDRNSLTLSTTAKMYLIAAPGAYFIFVESHLEYMSRSQQ